MWNGICNINIGNMSIYDLTEDDFIYINICGMVYVTLKTTLERFPLTLLGNQDSRQRYYIKSKNAYYFDRNRKCFDAILYYYQTGGLLVRPPDILMPSFIEEVLFFHLGEDALVKLMENEGYIPEDADEVDLPKHYLQKKVWELFEFSDSSIAAGILATWSVLVILASIILYCLETMPSLGLGETKKHLRMLKAGRNITRIHDSTPIIIIQPWFSLEIVCVVWFTLEYTIRFFSSPNKWRFFTSLLNLIDLLAIVPYIITMSMSTGVLRVVRLVRVFRIFKLSRYSMGLQVLGETFKASISELGMLVFSLLLGVILFSSVIYYAEEGEKSDMFKSIPDTFWYCVVTMTTVGYGDMVPQTLTAKIIGGCAAVVGAFTVSLPIPVIVSNFVSFYKKYRVSCISRKRKRTLSVTSAHTDLCFWSSGEQVVELQYKASSPYSRVHHINI